MPWFLIVEMERMGEVAAAVLLGVLTDLHQPPRTLQPNGSCPIVGRGFGLVPIRSVSRFQGLTAEGIEKIHQHQLLMLLLVLKAQFHELQPGGGGISFALEQVFQGLVHLVPPSDHLCHWWPAE